MRGLVRITVAVLSIAAGSVVGLRTPAAPPPPKPPTATAKPVPPPDEAPPSSTENASELAPWPRLNPEASMVQAWRLAEGPHRREGDGRRLVTLTFDDGPFPETTPKVLDLLDKHGVRATFFVIGRYLDGGGERARASRAVLQDTVARGHLVGNHTHDHTLLTAISHTQVLEQIDRGAASIERVTGVRPILFRPPFGELDAYGQDAVRARGLDILLWSVETQDMSRDDTAGMFREITSQLRAREGGVVLLHDIRWSSVRTLERLLLWLAARRWDPNKPALDGYVVVDLPTYLREVQASPPLPGARPLRRKPSES